MNIKHIFFDLDHTLWDFDKNSKLTFEQIFNEKNIKVEIQDFLKVYMPINLKYWRLYREEKIKKNELRYKRLKDSFNELNLDISDSLLNQISEDYIKYLPNHNYLMNGAIEILKYLNTKYELHIITNGFEEVQNLKLQKSGIDIYFKEIITSESAGVKKPNQKVFKFALNKVGVEPEDSLMIGDSYEADVIGAINAGMLAIYFNPEKKQENGILTIDSLVQLKQYL